MRFCLHLAASSRASPDARLPGDAVSRIGALIADIPHLAGALVHTPAHARDPFLAETAAPMLVLQLTFATIGVLEAAMSSGGPLCALADEPARFGLDGCEMRQQAMALRTFPVPVSVPARTTSCSYLVSYDGEAQDRDAWLAHYLTQHTALMARLPAIRAIEVMTRLDAVSHLPWRRETSLLRNRVTFDTPEALTAALNSPIRAEMRADFYAFPRFTGTIAHFPMETRMLGRQIG